MDYQLHHGDCLEIMPGLEAGSVDAIIADWPYSSIDAKWDYLIPLDMLWANCKWVLKHNGVTILTGQQPFTSLLVASNLKQFRHSWVWEKDKCGNFMSAQAGPLKVTEDVLVFSGCGFAYNSRNRATYNPQMAIAEMSHSPNNGSERGLSLNQIHIRPNPARPKSSQNYNGNYRYPKNILYFPVDYGVNRLHPTQKPVALLEYLVKSYTNPGDVVLDNTFGSCTTGEACLRTGRRFIGIEKDDNYFRIGQERMERVKAELSAMLPNFQMIGA